MSLLHWEVVISDEKRLAGTEILDPITGMVQRQMTNESRVPVEKMKRMCSSAKQNFSLLVFLLKYGKSGKQFLISGDFREGIIMMSIAIVTLFALVYSC